MTTTEWVMANRRKSAKEGWHIPGSGTRPASIECPAAVYDELAARASARREVLAEDVTDRGGHILFQTVIVVRTDFA